MAHGIFPTHNHYYLRTEIFPYISKKEMKEVYYPTKESRSKVAAKRDVKLSREDEEVLAKYRAK